MKKRVQVYKLFWYIFLTSYFVSCPVFAENFPTLTLFNIDGETSLFPSKKNELIFLGFRLSAKEELFLWYKSLIQNKVDLKNIHCVVLPVLPSWMSFCVARKPLFAACHNKLPKEARPYVQITFCNGEKLAGELGLFPEKGDLEHIQVYFLNDQGVICWHITGKPTPETIQQFIGLL